MKTSADSKRLSSPHKEVAPGGTPQRAAILCELEKILNSHGFRASKRSQEFLSYVVMQTLAGNAELLKERSIGVEVFHRPAGYSTGDDGVVRGQAGEVRRRLEQYYHEQGDSTADLF
jgi:hypothetical protein